MKKGPANADEKEKAKTFAVAAVTEMRLQQGWDHLDEMRIEPDKKAVSKIMKWVCDDAMLEEKSVSEELKVDQKVVREAVGNMAGYWFLQKLMKDEVKE